MVKTEQELPGYGLRILWADTEIVSANGCGICWFKYDQSYSQ